MGLRTRYLVSLFVLVAVMTAPALYGVYRIGEMRDIALDLRRDVASTTVATGRLSRELAELDRLQRAFVATGDTDLRFDVDRHVASIEAQIDSLLAAGYESYVRHADVPVSALRATADSLKALVVAGALDEATAHLGEVALPLLRSADHAVSQLATAIDQGTSRRVVEAERIAGGAVAATWIAMLVAMLVAVLFASFAAQVLTGPLDRLRLAMVGAADGRLESTSDPAYDRGDEVGELFRSFRTMTTRLAELDRMKAEFVGIASHDLKTPINVISGYAELMGEAESSLGVRHRQVLQSLRAQARSLGERVDQLIDISRMEARGLRLGLEEINVRHFASAVRRAFEPVAASHGIGLDVSVDPDAPTFLVADPDCLRRDVMSNVVGHCVKFSPRGQDVKVLFRGGGGRLFIEVRDDGPPLQPEEVQRLFDRYATGVSESGRVGPGLGLPIARAGVEAHGGRISASPVSSGSGIRFVIEMPLRPIPVAGLAGGVRAEA